MPTGHCHCGAPLVGWAANPECALKLLNGQPKICASCENGRRHFCADCGTGLI